MQRKAFRGSFAHCVSDPYLSGDEALEFLDDGILIVSDGRVDTLANAASVADSGLLQGIEVIDYSGHLIVPGFVDTHLHYPQTDIIASHGKQLLDWLEQYTFPAEQEFAVRECADERAAFFIQELLRNGTTTAMVFATVHPHSVDALFTVAAQRNLRIIAGKVMMDRNCPAALRDTAEKSYEQSQQLIDRWQGVGRLDYAVTPRFAPTSTDLQLQFAGKLFAENKGVYLQSHVAENHHEIRWVAELFPWARSYLDVYDHHGLLGEKSVFAHCIHLDDIDFQRMRDTLTVAAFCPTSNLFLGSGLFDYHRARESGVRTSLATDVGAGTSFSMLRTADEAYKVAQLVNRPVTPVQLFYEMTLGGATALSLQDCIGNFEPGKEADFTVLDFTRLPLLHRRISVAETIAEKLFALMLLGDDRCTEATYLMGDAAYVSG